MYVYVLQFSIISSYSTSGNREIVMYIAKMVALPLGHMPHVPSLAPHLPVSCIHSSFQFKRSLFLSMCATELRLRIGSFKNFCLSFYICFLMDMVLDHVTISLSSLKPLPATDLNSPTPPLSFSLLLLTYMCLCRYLCMCVYAQISKISYIYFSLVIFHCLFISS